MTRIETQEINQIVEDLYKYLKTINLGVELDYEFLREKEPALAFKQVSTSAQKLQEYLAGGYDAELPFVIYHKSKVIDTRKTLDITKPLNILASIFETETTSNFPNLVLKNINITPVVIEMVNTPEDATGIENNVATYVATYKFVYHKKGRFE